MSELVEVAIVGGGPAGLSAAIAIADAGGRPVVFDEQAHPGGQLRYRLTEVIEPDGEWLLAPRLAEKMTARAIEAGVDIRRGSRVWGLFPGRTIGVESGGKSTTITADRILLANGSVDRALPFPGGSLPGVFTARAVQILLNVQFVRPGRRFAIVADEPRASELGREIVLAGGEVIATLPIATGDLVASGEAGVTWLSGDGLGRDVDVVVIAAGRLADAGLALMAECSAGYSEEFGCFVPRIDDWMQTSVPGLYVAGDCAGPCQVELALAEGTFAGECVAASLGLRSDTDRETARQAYLKTAGGRQRTLKNVTGAFVQVDRVPMGVMGNG